MIVFNDLLLMIDSAWYAVCHLAIFSPVAPLGEYKPALNNFPDGTERNSC
jgi:hypothetical protein